ncbi:MAG: DUF6503 family protein [Bacteroidota bacterium]
MKYFLILFSTLLLTCQTETEDDKSSPYEKIEDIYARHLLENAVQAAGGLEKWESKKTIIFQKYVVLYDSAGNTEQATWQAHEYIYTPQQNIVKITWEKEDQQYKIVADKVGAMRYVNEQEDTTTSTQSLQNTVLSATFVISLPFKLLDGGVQLSHGGQKVIEDSLQVEVLKAVYNAEAHENHSNQDIWELYFDAKDYKMLGYQVQHDDHISYVLNESFTTANGLLFPHLRKSYRVNEQGEKLFLRAEYEYKDYEVE